MVEFSVKLPAAGNCTPLIVTTTLPLDAFPGTGTVIKVGLQPHGLAGAPLKVTVPVVPRFAPVILTTVPTPPLLGDIPEIVGVAWKVNVCVPDVDTPLTVTTTLPVLPPPGAMTAIEVLLQLLAVAVAPLNVTVLVPCVEPKFVPAIVTDVPAIPEDGERLVIVGGGFTVKV